MNDWTLPGLLDKFRSETDCRIWLEAARRGADRSSNRTVRR